LRDSASFEPLRVKIRPGGLFSTLVREKIITRMHYTLSEAIHAVSRLVTACTAWTV